jgi:transposase-like protein
MVGTFSRPSATLPNMLRGVRISASLARVLASFPDEAACVAHLEELRWAGRPVCPYCRSSRSTPMPTELRHHCNACNTSYSVRVGTPFHRSRTDLPRWFLALGLVLRPGRTFTARQLGTELGVHRNTAWAMAGKIRRGAMQQGPFFRSIVEGVVTNDD